MITTWTYKTESPNKIGDFDINIGTKLYNAVYKTYQDNKIFKNQLVAKNSNKKTPHEVTKDSGLILSVLFDYFGFWNRKKMETLKIFP